MNIEFDNDKPSYYARYLSVVTPLSAPEYPKAESYQEDIQLYFKMKEKLLLYPKESRGKIISNTLKKVLEERS